jgi:hypothetical protein
MNDSVLVASYILLRIVHYRDGDCVRFWCGDWFEGCMAMSGRSTQGLVTAIREGLGDPVMFIGAYHVVIENL